MGVVGAEVTAAPHGASGCTTTAADYMMANWIEFVAVLNPGSLVTTTPAGDIWRHHRQLRGSW